MLPGFQKCAWDKPSAEKHQATGNHLDLDVAPLYSSTVGLKRIPSVEFFSRFQAKTDELVSVYALYIASV